MFCIRCGSQMPDGTRFCMRCGQPLVPPRPAYDAPRPVAPNPYAPPVYAAPAYGASAAPKPPMVGFSAARTVGRDQTVNEQPSMTATGFARNRTVNGSAAPMPEPEIRFSKNFSAPVGEEKSASVQEEAESLSVGAPIPMAQPVPMPEPTSVEEPVAVPMSFPEEPSVAPMPKPEPMPEPVPEAVFEPVPKPEPMPEPVPEAVFEPVPKPEPMPEPVPEAVSEPMPKPEPMPEPVPEAVFEPVPKPEPMPEPVSEIVPETVLMSEPATVSECVFVQEPTVEEPVAVPAEFPEEPTAAEEAAFATEPVCIVPGCPGCGRPIREGAKFCNHCGADLATAEPVITEATCPVCGHPLVENARFCTNCGTTLQQETAAPAAQEDVAPAVYEAPASAAPAVYEAPAPAVPAAAEKTKKEKKTKAAKKPGKLKKILLIGGAVLLALVIGVAVWGYLTDWWGLTGPIMQVVSAAGDTMEAESMTVDFSLKKSEDDLITGTLTMEIDHDARDLAMLLKITGGDTDVAVGIYDEQLLYEVDGEANGAVYIGAELDDFFDDMEEGDSASLDEMVEAIVDLLLKDEKIRNAVSKDELHDAIISVLFSLNTRSWAKENAGFSEETRGDMEVLIYSPKFGDLADGISTELKPAFKKDADYKDFKKWIADNREDLNDTVDLTLEFGIEDDCLTHVSVKIAKEDRSLSLVLDADKINKTKVDTEALEAMLDRS